ncbi:MAG: hypothetical protein CMQ15_11280 [Gammaproteobacteria bacterium]|jgi:hypothetical protein|nr:hypothetical protein [Gammaproteobacteria bacterium]|tara:strand:- start:5975 stop:6232 length:258 start_codon:yes stop_codon:yes gene_type:complete
MDRNESSRLIEALKNGTVTVTFKKIITDEVRVMPCTLNPVVLEAYDIKSEIKDVNPETDHLAVWALDKEAWRSFRLSTVVGWEVL